MTNSSIVVCPERDQKASCSFCTQALLRTTKKGNYVYKNFVDHSCARFARLRPKRSTSKNHSRSRHHRAGYGAFSYTIPNLRSDHNRPALTRHAKRQRRNIGLAICPPDRNRPLKTSRLVADYSRGADGFCARQVPARNGMQMIPAKLKRLYRANGKNLRQTARALKVNIYYIQRLLVHGEEPKNPHIRLALFLPAHPRRPKAERPPRPPLPEHVQWWRKLPKEYRDTLIQCEYQSSLENGE